MTAASKADKSEKPKPQKNSSRRIRKIMTPVKEGTIKRSVIRKVIKEVIANRPASNEI
jgi:hypothetical protein